MKTSELIGLPLDWAVFKAGHKGAELHYFVDDPFKKEPWLLINGLCEMPLHGYTPTADWHQGGSIIEKHGIHLEWSESHEHWLAYSWDRFSNPNHHMTDGDTALIAAMRCYVASKLGDEVEIPEELK